MTEPGSRGLEPGVAGHHRARADGDDYVIDGRKWFTSGADGAAFAIVMAVTDARGRAAHARQPDPRADRHAGLPPRAQHPGDGRGGIGLLQPRRGARSRAAACPRRDAHRRGGRGVRARAGAARARAHPPLHALDRRLRARARHDVRARARGASSRPGERLASKQARAARDRGQPGRDRRRAPARAAHGGAHRRGGGGGRARATSRSSSSSWPACSTACSTARSRCTARSASPTTPCSLLVPPRARGAHLRRARRGPQVRAGPPRPAALRRGRRDLMVRGRTRAALVDQPRPVRPGEELDAAGPRRVPRARAARADGAAHDRAVPAAASRTSPTSSARAAASWCCAGRPPGAAIKGGARHGRASTGSCPRLAPVYAKAPRPLAYCEDRVRARRALLPDGARPGRHPARRRGGGGPRAPTTRRALSESLVDTLAELHALDRRARRPGRARPRPRATSSGR